MAIPMQGLWLVKVKSKNAAYPQQFQIAGAGPEDGIYPGTHPGEILVTGNSWTITIRHDPGTGFQSSQVKLNPPTLSGGFYKFDILSNDSGGDTDFNDLVLTCRTPKTANDYLIYGKVSDYQGLCLWNPCNPLWVIDTPLKLEQALAIPQLKDYLREWYPDRISAGPQPEPPLFVPLVVPKPGEPGTPFKQKYVLTTEEKEFSPELAKRSKKAAAKSAALPTTVSYTATKSIQALKASELTLDSVTLRHRAALEKLTIKPAWYCDKDPLANTRVRFFEYDRTPAELSGGAYTGEGARQYLGSTYTDDFGNYIFRFTRENSEIVDELLNDVAPGENAAVQIRPDIIAQVMQPLAPYELACETAPFWNISQLRRINICVPREKIGFRPLVCEGQHIIQGIGNIALGRPNIDGSRTDFSNILTNTGIITVNSSVNPKPKCAAWHGNLIMSGCLKNPNIKYYNLESRQPFTTWENLNISFDLPRFFGPPHINQGVHNGKSYYLNVENDGGDWLMAYRNIKAKFPTTHSNFENGTNFIRITGLDSSKNPIPGVQEIVPLYIVNNSIDLQIDSAVRMEDVGSISDCGLFTLPAGNDGAPITVRFKATQGQAPPIFAGFMNRYSLYIQKGSSLPEFPVNQNIIDHTAPYTTEVNNRGRRYVPAVGGGDSCDLSFFGTVNEPSEVNGYVEVTLAPTSGGWLEPGQNFCTFGVELHGALRRTNGQSVNSNSRAVPVLFGIQR